MNDLVAATTGGGNAGAFTGGASVAFTNENRYTIPAGCWYLNGTSTGNINGVVFGSVSGTPIPNNSTIVAGYCVGGEQFPGLQNGSLRFSGVLTPVNCI